MRLSRRRTCTSLSMEEHSCGTGMKESLVLQSGWSEDNWKLRNGSEMSCLLVFRVANVAFIAMEEAETVVLRKLLSRVLFITIDARDLTSYFGGFCPSTYFSRALSWKFSHSVPSLPECGNLICLAGSIQFLCCEHIWDVFFRHDTIFSQR